MKTKLKLNTLIATIIGAAALMLVSCASTGNSAASNSSGVKPYTSNVCAMTDNELGSMGPVITKVYQGKEVKFCCKPCVAKFEKNLEKNLSKL